MNLSFLDISSIEVVDRQRLTIAAVPLQGLKDSLQSKSGLLHPIIVRQIQGDKFYIIAGERRYRAISSLHEDELPFRFAGSIVESGKIPAIIADSALTDTDIFEAELTENIQREDLTWQERTIAISDLHKLRKAQNPKQTYTDTARELAPSRDIPDAHPESLKRRDASRIVDAELIAAHLDEDIIAQASNARIALKLVLKKLQRQFEAASKPKEKSIHTLHFENFFDVHFEPEQFSVVIADPPYGVGVKSFGTAASLRHEYTEADYVELHQELAKKLTIICAKDAHVYLFCDIDFFHQVSKMFRDLDWRVRRAPLIWEKGKIGHLEDGDIYGFRRCYEFIMSARRGDRAYKMLQDDVIHVAVGPDRIHAAQKPVELYATLLRMSIYAGEEVLDPFAGSGPIFGAANLLSCPATGCEIDETYAKHLEEVYQLEREPCNSRTSS